MPSLRGGMVLEDARLPVSEPVTVGLQAQSCGMIVDKIRTRLAFFLSHLR